MSEKFESSIERLNTRVTYQLGAKAIMFDMLNSKMYEHSERYKEFDHIFRKNDNKPGGAYYFRSDFDELYSTLDEYSFPKSRVAYPTEQDEEVWVKRENKRISDDLELFERSGDEYL